MSIKTARHLVFFWISFRFFGFRAASAKVISIPVAGKACGVRLAASPVEFFHTMKANMTGPVVKSKGIPTTGNVVRHIYVHIGASRRKLKQREKVLNRINESLKALLSKSTETGCAYSFLLIFSTCSFELHDRRFFFPPL